MRYSCCMQQPLYWHSPDSVKLHHILLWRRVTTIRVRKSAIRARFVIFESFCFILQM